MTAANRRADSKRDYLLRLSKWLMKRWMRRYWCKYCNEEHCNLCILKPTKFKDREVTDELANIPDEIPEPPMKLPIHRPTKVITDMSLEHVAMMPDGSVQPGVRVKAIKPADLIIPPREREDGFFCNNRTVDGRCMVPIQSSHKVCIGEGCIIKVDFRPLEMKSAVEVVEGYHRAMANWGTRPKLAIDDWKCPCCLKVGNFEYDGTGGLRCKESGLCYNRNQMERIQGSWWVGEGDDESEVRVPSDEECKEAFSHLFGDDEK